MDEAPRLAPLTLHGVVFDPPLFCAPMAAITHSAFRRLLSDFGGYGALFTEMLSARMILREDRELSPCLKRRPREGKVVYQLMVTDTVRLPEIIDRLSALRPDGLDLNAACAAHAAVRQRCGSDLFEDAPRLREVLRVMRRCFSGPLFAKIRLGRQCEGWRGRLEDRLRLMADEGVDALTVHPRFFEEKFKRSARHALYGELARQARLPIIASGDIGGPEDLREHAGLLAPVSGVMIGRMAAACPWVFARWRDPGLRVDHAAVWRRLCDYVAEDFAPAPALVRLKVIAPYFARNFSFGHTFFKAVHAAPDLASALRRAEDFLSAGPALVRQVSVGGI
ncbi:MAG: tRNA-dihydrouridine synthase family protein [Elusimicrobia bacterium]|nr:tRNA-dihydrouridine synthase family protein [Elusimicrobiota bacterium]